MVSRASKHLSRHLLTSATSQGIQPFPCIHRFISCQQQSQPQQQRHQSVSQRPGSDRVHFPGAVDSKFTTNLTFKRAEEKDALPTYRILDQEGQVIDKSYSLNVSDSELLKMYTDMVKVSIMDLIMFDAQRQGRISFYMVSAGEEGIAVGSASALDATDPIFAQYRETGIFQYRGFTMDEFMAQLFTTKNDPGKGRNMPVHYGSETLHVHTISSPLATQIPQASGGAYAIKMANALNPTDPQRVVACYFGEGAASEGDFHAGLNIAATRGCPILFICRNNGYAISTPTLEQYRGDGIASRGIGYGIDTIRVDGNDVLAVREATRQARKIALEDGGKPVLLEAMSYRVSHHSTSDDSFAYRAKIEVQDWKRRDNPITRLRKFIETRGLWDENKERELRSDARKEVLDAYRKADKDKKPSIGYMMTDVYERITEEQQEQVKRLKEHIEKYPNEYDLSGYEGGLSGFNVEDTSKR
ncbi:thiamine diphosphate-binding protein [Polychaeton citri CBS 116435]|uniref:2-oxoisovalerate dehydrogenase subunit alpha n=1 Tax=Polychaeton citri CBS 116435 TaxID=1314669 RepID=A0A9P4Q728_9PEZI|nr:thiamine diphosphate-binding protein [Polychaeton citri CBS 116435]